LLLTVTHRNQVESESHPAKIAPLSRKKRLTLQMCMDELVRGESTAQQMLILIR